MINDRVLRNPLNGRFTNSWKRPPVVSYEDAKPQKNIQKCCLFEVFLLFLQRNIIQTTMRLKNVIGYEGIYAVSDEGSVFNLKKGGEIKQTVTKGYCRVMLQGKMFFVHRIVFEAFHGKLVDGLVIDHIDGNPLNNNVSNLRQITSRDNVSVGYRRKKNHKERPTGVSYFENIKKYGAYIQIEKEKFHLGVFDTMEDASMAYKFARDNWMQNGIKPTKKDTSKKYCKECQQIKPREDFYIKSNGWASCLCKECTKKTKKKQYWLDKGISIND